MPHSLLGISNSKKARSSSHGNNVLSLAVQDLVSADIIIMSADTGYYMDTDDVLAEFRHNFVSMSIFGDSYKGCRCETVMVWNPAEFFQTQHRSKICRLSCSENSLKNPTLVRMSSMYICMSVSSSTSIFHLRELLCEGAKGAQSLPATFFAPCIQEDHCSMLYPFCCQWNLIAGQNNQGLHSWCKTRSWTSGCGWQAMSRYVVEYRYSSVAFLHPTPSPTPTQNCPLTTALVKTFHHCFLAFNI